MMAVATHTALTGAGAALRAETRTLKRKVWRNCVQRRCSRYARVLRVAPKAVMPRYGGRLKMVDGSWVLFSEAPNGVREPALEIRFGRIREFEDFRQPIRVIIRNNRLVDVALLSRLLAQGKRRGS